MNKSPWSQLEDRQKSLRKMWKAAEEVLNRATGRKAVLPSTKTDKPVFQVFKEVLQFKRYYDHDTGVYYEVNNPNPPGRDGFVHVAEYVGNNFAVYKYVSKVWLISHCKTTPK